jgi:hypothetical protein
MLLRKIIKTAFIWEQTRKHVKQFHHFKLSTRETVLLVMNLSYCQIDSSRREMYSH